MWVFVFFSCDFLFICFMCCDLFVLYCLIVCIFVFVVFGVKCVIDEEFVRVDVRFVGDFRICFVVDFIFVFFVWEV